MTWLVVTLKVKDGMQTEFETVMGDLVAKVRANEPGCLTYTLTKSKVDPTEYVMIEHYASPEARAEHGKTEYFRAAGPKLGPTLAGRAQIVELDLIV